MAQESILTRPSVPGCVAVLAAVAAIALALWVLGSILDVLLLCFAGTLLGLFLHGTGAQLGRWTGIPSRVAVGVFCVLLVGVAVLTIWLAAPSVAAQADELSTALPRALEKLTGPLEQFSWGRAALERISRPDDIIERHDTWSRAGGVISTTLGSFGTLFVVVFVGLFLAFDPELYVRGFLRLVPANRRTHGAEILSQTSHTLQLWMIGKLASMAVVGIATGVGLALLGIPLALVLALLAAVLTFIPNFGPVLSVVPALLLALLQGTTQALWVAGLYFGIQTVESYLITPLMQKKMVALPPALTLVAQVVMGTLAGGLGLVVATPLTAVALVFVREAYIKEVLGDDRLPPS